MAAEAITKKAQTVYVQHTLLRVMKTNYAVFSCSNANVIKPFLHTCVNTGKQLPEISNVVVRTKPQSHQKRNVLLSNSLATNEQTGDKCGKLTDEKCNEEYNTTWLVQQGE